MISHRYKILIALIAVTAALAVIGGTWIIATRIQNNCTNTHRLLIAIDNIMEGQNQQILEAPSLSHEEKVKYLAINAENRRVLQKADCTNQRSIPGG